MRQFKFRDLIPQFHLSTAICMMFVAALLLWINARPTANGGVGWPMHVITSDPAMTKLLMLGIDGLLGVAVLSTTAALLESWIDESRK